MSIEVKEPKDWGAFCECMEEQLGWKPKPHNNADMQAYLIFQMGMLYQLKRQSADELKNLEELSNKVESLFDKGKPGDEDPSV